MASLLAVYRDRDEAEATAHDLLDHASTEPSSLHIAERRDLELSIRAEMDQEFSDSVGSPGLGAFMTKEMARGAILFGLGLGAIGLVVGALLGLVYPGVHGWNTGDRVLLGVVIGALFFGTVGTLLGGGLAMKSPEDRLAAQRGVTLRSDAVTRDVERIMSAHHPIRLDRLADTRRVETIVTEGPSGIAEAIEEFRANAADPRRQG
jgi:hypothetical protein